VAIETIEQQVQTLLQRPRFTGWVLTSFAAIGLLLAAIGLYGVVAYGVAQRTKEIGIRIAVGAQTGSIVVMSLRNAMTWAAIGAVAGVLLSLGTSRMLRGMLFEVPERDPRILIGALLVLAVAAVAASLIPAHRAARVDPIVALRQD
jgi:ABC-type antimicrobial peptide transport system permease subunit